MTYPAEEHPNKPLDQIAEGRLWKQASAGDERAREDLVRHYLPFAEAMANRYRTAREPHEDLQQVASMGLLKAIDRFDPDRGVPFKGFAGPTILGELKRHFRDRVGRCGSRVPFRRDRRRRAGDRRLEAELQRTPTVREIAEHLGRSETDVLEALEANMHTPTRLDRPAGANRGRGLGTGGRADRHRGCRLRAGRRGLTIEQELPHLDERERRVINSASPTT